MKSVPSWVDFEYAEQTAAVMARDLAGLSEAWGTLFANAQAVLASRTDLPTSELPQSYDFQHWRDLIATARILDLGATDLGVKNRDNRKTAAILAACAFGMSGTSVSATAVVSSHRLLNSDLSPGELTALALSSPALCRRVFPRLPDGSNYRRCLENVAAYLQEGSGTQIQIASDALEQATLEERDPWVGYLLRLSRVSIVHAARLAVSRVLQQFEHSFPIGYLDSLIADSPMLLPSQYEAINDYGILTDRQNLLIALPTGTGKTLLGELALLSAFGREPGLVCYIAPYVALGRQAAEKMDRHAPRGVRVHRLVGGYQAPEPVDPENYLEVVVATPERFDALLRLRPDLLSFIRCVVFDEAHMIGNGHRGIILEGLITRFRLAELRGEHVPRFILLSAVLSNADSLAAWIGIPPENIIRGTWQPTAKRLLRWTEDGMLRLHAGDDPLHSRPSEVLGESRLPWPQVGFYRARHFGAIRQQIPRVLENLAFLAEFEHMKYRQPVLCVCSTRPRTRQLASRIANRFSALEPMPQSVKAIVDTIDRSYRYLRPLREALRRGVAYHNSSLPQSVREGIERAVEARTLRVVAATTTLAEGVDLPFRVTILADWLMFDGETSQPMESLLFKNIAGRCGRAGQFTEGDTIVFDNPVGDARLTSPARRPSLQHRIFFPNSQPILTSAIGHLDQEFATATVGSQLLAAIAENPEVPDLAAGFWMQSFGYHTDNARNVARRIKLALQEILDDADGEPLAIAASPVQLTSFGQAAKGSGLSPSTAKRLRESLDELSHLEASNSDFVAICAELLKSLGDVAEQRNTDLRKAVERPRSRPIVRLTEIDLVLELWTSGESLETIFAALPSSKRSRRQPSLQTWLQGVVEESTWTDQFAKFSDFMDSCVEFFLPWILRAARALDEADMESERPWSDWASFVELGIDSVWGARLLESGLVSDRRSARIVGQRLDVMMFVGEPSIEKVLQALGDEFGRDYEMAERILNLYRRHS